MSTTQLLTRNLAYYWRTNVAVLLGVAIAVAVLAGALLVGDSVRHSLQEIFSQRLGKTDQVVAATSFFREQLADDIKNDAATCALISLKGVVVNEQNKRRAGDVNVYGIDEKFWRFHGQPDHSSPTNREVLISEGLAKELGSNAGDSLLLRVAQPSDIPRESLHGRKEDVGRTLRLTSKETLPATALGDFSLRPQQGDALTVFVSLRFLQKELGQENKVNTILVAGSQPVDALQSLLGEKATLDDAGIRLRPVTEERSVSFETDSKVISDELAQSVATTAKQMSLPTTQVLSYLANSIDSGGKSIPYSLVTAVDQATFNQIAQQDPQALKEESSPIILNEWAAKDLGVTRGAQVVLQYYLWHENGQLETKTARFRMVAVVPIAGIAAARDLVPSYPGITESENLSDWDPPFPIDLDKVRKVDEDYWHQYRTTPKAFIPLAEGQQLWRSRFGQLSSIRIPRPNADSFGANLRKNLTPAVMGFQVVPVRTEGLQASRGATDFGEYFLYFSFFLVVSALLLTALFFKLGIEQRLREIGTLQAIGFPASRIRRIFLVEGVALAVGGSLLGLLGAIVYGALIMFGLRTWWVDAVGTTSLKLHVTWASLIFGALGGVFAAIICIVLTLRKVGRESTRSLLSQTLTLDQDIFNQRKRRLTRSRVGIAFTLIGLLLLLASAVHVIPQVAGFFGAGLALLIACLCYLSAWLRRRDKGTIHGTGLWSLSLLGFRNSTYRPARTVICVTLIASAAFIVVAVDAFRRSGSEVLGRKSGSGGFPLLAESLLPLVPDPNTAAGREALNLDATGPNSPLNGLAFTRFRVRPGDDTSCLNLYQPTNPRIVAPTDDLISSDGFAFQKTLATTVEEKANPWLLLQREFPDGAIPVLGDANSLTYVMHLGVGDDLLLGEGSTTVRLRVVGAFADSVFQSELVMSDQNFVRLFPEVQGYQFFLIDTPDHNRSGEAATALEDRLSDFGFDATSTGERLASFHRVENTYLSTFQMLGGLGLILGTLGMAVVLLRNVFERRRELALLRVVGYNSLHFALMVIAENILMLVSGLAIGFICAVLAIAPVFFERGGRLPNVSLGVLLLGVFLSGTIASLVATLAALRSPLLPALRSE
jgi:ABC-type antimicrobial peptide transport system permease subunit